MAQGFFHSVFIQEKSFHPFSSVDLNSGQNGFNLIGSQISNFLNYEDIFS